jgi:hypothetical protein
MARTRFLAFEAGVEVGLGQLGVEFDLGSLHDSGEPHDPFDGVGGGGGEVEERHEETVPVRVSFA